MAIKEVLGSGVVPVDSVRKANASAEEKPKTDRADRVELSSEARSLFETSQAKRDEEIRSRVESGFYSRPDVLERIAQEVLQDLRNVRE